jgi:hypothetical protein
MNLFYDILTIAGLIGGALLIGYLTGVVIYG